MKIIKETAEEIFGKDVQVFIFGSRACPEKRGGDIDILVKASRDVTVSEELDFLAKLKLKGIIRKVDLLVITPKMKLKQIHKEVLSKGVRI